MKTIDLFKDVHKAAYKATLEPTLVEVPKINYLLVDGAGSPDDTAFQNAVGALYTMAYTLKFMVKKGETKLEPVDFKVAPLEAQWYMPDMKEFSMDNKKDWLWTAMIAVPDLITAGAVELARTKTQKKKPDVKVDAVKLSQQEDGLAGQIMHVGPYATEPATIKRLHAFIKESGCHLTGRHREIYLGDPRRTAPEKLKTILRQPCRKS